MLRVCPFLVSAILGVALVSPASSQDKPKYYRIVSENSGKVLAIADGSKDGGAKLYKTHYEDDTQVYDGYLAVFPTTGEVRMLASYQDG